MTRDDFAAVLTVSVDGFSPVHLDRKTLVIFEADNLPVGQVWLEAGELGEVPKDVMARVARRRSAAPAAPTTTSVSVVICTRDRPDELRRCLASFPLQSRPPDEIIVVDNASVAATTREVTLAAGATYISENRPGLDFARNSGALAASGELVLYTDDDTELHPIWVEQCVAAFDDPIIAAVTGLVLPATLSTEAQWLFEDQWSFGRGFDRIDYDQLFYRATRAQGCPVWMIGAGANMAFRRSIFDQIGLFDERLDVGRAGCSGDSEYWYRILAAGLTCRYEPTAVVYHHHRATLQSLASQIFHYMRGHTAALLVQHERTGDRGNLYRAFVTMPKQYARGAVGRLVRGKRPSNQFLGQQVKGAAAGIIYFWQETRSAKRSPPAS